MFPVNFFEIVKTKRAPDPSLDDLFQLKRDDEDIATIAARVCGEQSNLTLEDLLEHKSTAAAGGITHTDDADIAMLGAGACGGKQPSNLTLEDLLDHGSTAAVDDADTDMGRARVEVVADPLILATGSIFNPKNMLEGLGSYKRYEAFSIDPKIDVLTEFRAILKKSLLSLDEEADPAQVSGIKRKRTGVESKPIHTILDIADVRLYLHAIGDGYLKSVEESQGFNPKDLLEVYSDVIKNITDVGLLDKTGYCNAVEMILKYQEKISSCSLSKGQIDEVLLSTILDFDKKDSPFIKVITKGEIQAWIAANPCPFIDVDFFGKLQEWFESFIKEYPLKKDHRTIQMVDAVIHRLYHKHTQNLDLLCDGIKEDLDALNEGETLFLPTGFAGVMHGHFCLGSITKQSIDTYKIKIYNTGMGLEAHHGMFYENKRYAQVFIEFNNVPKDILCQKNASGTLSVFMCFFEYIDTISLVYQNHIHPVNLEKVFYENLFIYLGGFFNHFPKDQPFVRPQKTGTCVYRVIKALAYDFCKSEDYKKVVFEIKKEIFYKAFLSLAEKHQQIRSIKEVEADLLLRCTKKLSDLVYQEIRKDTVSFIEKAEILSDIQEAVCFIEECQKQKSFAKREIKDNWNQFVTVIDPKKIESYLLIFDKASKDLELQEVPKFRGIFKEEIGSLGIEEQFKTLKQILDAGSSDPRFTKISLDDVYHLIKELSLNEDSFLKELRNPWQFLDDFMRVCLASLHEKDMALNIAFIGKAYLLAHKLLTHVYPKIFADLPISFGKYERNESIQHLTFSSANHRLVSAYIEDCMGYVESFNKTALSQIVDERKKDSFLFEESLKDSISLDSSYERPQGGQYPVDFLLYKRLIELEPDIKTALLKSETGKKKLWINAIASLYVGGLEEIQTLSPLCQAMFHLQCMKMHFDYGLQNYADHPKEDFIEKFDRVFKGRYKITADYKLEYLIVSSTNNSSHSLKDSMMDRLWMDIVKYGTKEKTELERFIRTPQHKAWAYELVDFVKSSPHKGLALMNWITDPEKLDWLQDKSKVLEWALFSSNKKDIANTQIFEEIKNPYFQAALVQALIHSCYQLSVVSKEKGDELNRVLMTLLSKIIPSINQGYIDFVKLDKIIDYILSSKTIADRKGHCPFNPLACIKLEFAKGLQEALAVKIVRFFVQQKEESDAELPLMEKDLAFWCFFTTNASVFEENLKLSQKVYEEICDDLGLKPGVLKKLFVDVEVQHIEFKMEDGSSLFIDIRLNPFIKNEKLEYISASKVLHRPMYIDFLEICSVPKKSNALGDLESEHGVYSVLEELFIPSDGFEKNIPDALKGKKWRYIGNASSPASDDESQFFYNMLGVCAPSFDGLFYICEGTSSHFILIDETHNPLATVSVREGSLTVFDCIEQKERYIPDQSLHVLSRKFRDCPLRYFKRDGGFDVALYTEYEGWQTLAVDIAGGLSTPSKVYLKQNLEYELISLPFQFQHLAFRHTKDKSQPDIIFLLLNIGGVGQKIFRVLSQNNKIITDNLAVLCQVSYSEFNAKNYAIVIDNLQKLNRRNKMLYETSDFERQVAESIFRDLVNGYKRFIVDDALYRYFILTLVGYFDLEIEKNTLIKMIYEDYLLDTNKEAHYTLSWLLMQSINKKLKMADGEVEIMSKKIGDVYKKTVFVHTIPLNFSDINAIVVGNLHVPSLDKGSSLFTQQTISFIDFLKLIKSGAYTDKQILKHLVGFDDQRSLLLKALVLEKTILQHLDLTKDFKGVQEAIAVHFGRVLTYATQSSLRYLKHPTCFKEYQVKPISLLSFSTDTSLEITTLFSKIKNYDRFLRVFIQSQLDLTTSADFETTAISMIKSLASGFDCLSEALKKNILERCLGHIDVTKSTIHSLDRYIPEHEQLCVEALLEPYLKETVEAYKEMFKRYRLIPFEAAPSQEKDFYQGLDTEIGVYLYLEILKKNLNKAIKGLLDNTLTKDALLPLIAYDPAPSDISRAQLVFEYQFGHALSSKQREIIDFLSSSTRSDSSFKLAQVVMGGGKSSVIVPLLGYMFSKKNPSCLLITPQAQLGSILKYLDTTLSQVFYQTVEHIHFRGANLSIDYYQDILKKLSESSKKSRLFVASPESLQFLELEFLRLLNEGDDSSDVIGKLSLIQKLLLHFYSKTAVMIDEFSHVADVTKHTSIPLFTKDATDFDLPKAYLSLSEDLFAGLVEIVKTEGGELKTVVENWKDYIEKLVDSFLLKEGMLCYQKEQALIRAFLIQKENKAFLKEESLCFIKYLLHFVLPHVLKKTRGRHFGRTFDKRMLGKVVPYQGVGSPASTEFGHYYEAICYHYLSCIEACYTEDELSILIMQLYENAKKQAHLSRSEIDSTEEGFFFQRTFGFSITEMENPESFDKVYNQMVSLHKEKDFLPFIKLESIFIQHYVKLRNVYLSSNPHNLTAQFSQVIGFTGTPWNQDSYSFIFKNGEKFDKEIEESINRLFLEKEKGSSLIFHQTIKDPKKILESFMDHPDFAKISSFIDTGGVFSNFTNQKVAELIGEVYLAKNPTWPQFDIIYFETSSDSTGVDTPCLLRVGKAQSHIKILNSLNQKDLIAAGVLLDRCFVYFDERHAVGTDMMLDKEAIGLITVDQNLSHHAFLQGLMRLRQYEKKQNAFVINFDEKTRAISTHGQLIEHLKKQEQQKLYPIVYRSFKQQIHNLFRQQAFARLRNCDSYRTLQFLYNKYKPFFVTEERITPSSLIEEALDLENPIEGLKNYANRLGEIEASFVDKTILSNLLEASKLYFTDVGIQPFFAFDTEVSLEEEVKTEVALEKEVEIELDLRDEIALLLQSKQDPEPKELTFPIKDVIEFFQEHGSKGEFKKESLTIKALKAFKADDASYEKGFNLNVSSNLLGSKGGGYVDIRILGKKSIFSFLAVCRLSEVMFIGLTEQETQTTLAYLSKNIEFPAVLVSLDREILTPSLVELQIKEKLLEIPSDFIEAYAYNGQVHRLLESSKQTHSWINDTDSGLIRKKFLRIQGWLTKSPHHKFLLEQCAKSVDVIKQKEVRIQNAIKDLVDASGAGDACSKITLLIRSIAIEEFKYLPKEFMEYVPLHLVRHFVKKEHIKSFTVTDKKVMTGAQRFLFESEEIPGFDDID